MKTKVLIATVLIFLVIQFFPISKENPSIKAGNDLTEQVTVDQTTKNLLKAACYDCHSHETTFPSYTRLQPVGWWLRSHVRGGRMKVNFSEWASYSSKEKIAKAQECKEVLEENRMPLSSYTWLHPEAKLDQASKQQLMTFFENLEL